MFILWRYILKEHIGPFIFAMCVITLVFLLNLVFRELGRILSRGLGIGLILEFFMLNMAWIIALAVPMAVLVAALMAFGRLSGDSEITAMKAGGVSIMHLITPVLAAALFLALFLIWFNNHVLPDFNHRARLLAGDIARKRPTLSLEPGVVYKDITHITILVQKIKEQPDTSYVNNIFIEDTSDPQKSVYIFAERGKIYLDSGSGLLYMELYDGEMHELDLEKMEQYTRLEFPRQVKTLSVPNMVLQRSRSEYRGDREKSAQMMMEEVKINDKELAERRERIRNIADAFFRGVLPAAGSGTAEQKVRASGAAKPAWAGPDRKAALLQLISEHRRLRQQLGGELNIVKNLDRANYVLMVEVHKKYSIPVACIVFVLIGAPLGIMSRKGNLAVAGGISFGFFLLYWATLIGGEELADNQLITPFWAMWAANLVVGAGGIYLVVHSIHEATFINWIAFSRFFNRILRLGNASS